MYVRSNLTCGKKPQLSQNMVERTGFFFFCLAAGIVTTVKGLDSEGHLYLGCYEDDRDERILSKKYVDAHMTVAVRLRKECNSRRAKSSTVGCRCRSVA